MKTNGGKRTKGPASTILLFALIFINPCRAEVTARDRIDKLLAESGKELPVDVTVGRVLGIPDIARGITFSITDTGAIHEVQRLIDGKYVLMFVVVQDKIFQLFLVDQNFNLLKCQEHNPGVTGAVECSSDSATKGLAKEVVYWATFRITQ